MSAAGPDADLVVVGSGAAGLMAACTAGPRVRTVLLTDRGLGTSNTAVAQGGLHVPTDDAEGVARYRADMVRSGGDEIEHMGRLDVFVRAVGPTVELLQSWGLGLDRDEAGTLVRRVAGGLSEPRIVTAGDRIGAALLRVLRTRLGPAGVDARTRTRVADITHDGVRFILTDAETNTHCARAVVLAVGGRVYEIAQRREEPTSNPANANGVLYDAVRRFGVPEVRSEDLQYHPYGVVDHDGGVSGACVPESVVELGARVVDQSGRCVAPEGADRRILTDAMFDALMAGRGEMVGERPSLRLTLGSVREALLRDRYPHLGRLYDRARLPSGDVRVVPIAHYQLGGFLVDGSGATAVPGLFLAGEMTGGLHGRNRLMGNGITEAVVDGHCAGEAAVRFLGELSSPGR